MESDLERLQGAWNIVTLEMDGRSYPSGGSRIVIQGGRFTSLNMGAEYQGTVTVDSSGNPKTFDLHFDQGPEAGNTSLGIYELDGDTWKICLGLTGKLRPREFAAPPGTGHALEILKRETDTERRTLQTQTAAAAAHVEPVAELEGEWFMVSCMQDGKPMDPRFVASARRVFHGNTTTLLMGKQVFMKSLFTVDAAQEPKVIHYLDLRQQGIYQVSGETLHTCLAAASQPSPADFTATSGDGRTVSKWSRRK